MKTELRLFAAYGYKSDKNIPTEFAIGEGLVGQVAFEKERIILSNVPGNYIQISSGLGRAKPANLIILPVLFENKVKAVIELASLDIFSETHLDFLSQLTESIGIVLNTIEASYADRRAAGPVAVAGRRTEDPAGRAAAGPTMSCRIRRCCS